MLRKMISACFVAGIFLLVFSCNNNSHGNRHGRMMEGGRMGSGSMMGDSMASGRQGMEGYGQNQPGSENVQQPLTLDQARQKAEEYLHSTGNTALEIGKGSAQGKDYEFPLIRKSDGSQVASLLVKKSTGEVVSQR
jgi:hypothetical protein